MRLYFIFCMNIVCLKSRHAMPNARVHTGSFLIYGQMISCAVLNSKTMMLLVDSVYQGILFFSMLIVKLAEIDSNFTNHRCIL